MADSSHPDSNVIPVQPAPGKHVMVAVSCALLFLFLGCLTLWIFSSPKQQIQPDTPEAWRKMLHGTPHAVQLASAILLAGVGDAEGTKALLQFEPSLTIAERQLAIRHLYIPEPPLLLSPQLVDVLLRNLQSYKASSDIIVMRLIPEGQETRFLPALVDVVDRTSSTLNLYPSVLDRIIATQNEDALEHCHKAFQHYLRTRPYRTGSEYEVEWKLVDVLIAVYAKNQRQCFHDITPENYPGIDIKNVQQRYLYRLPFLNDPEAAVDFWLSELPDDAKTSGSVISTPSEKGNFPQRTSPLRVHLADGIERNWDKMPEAPRARLTEKDRDAFTMTFLRNCAGGVCNLGSFHVTHDLFLRFMRESSDDITNLAKALIKDGDEKLRDALIEEGLKTKDACRLRSVLSLLKNQCGGIPPELAKSAAEFVAVPADKSVSSQIYYAQKEIEVLLGITIPPLPTAFDKGCKNSKAPWRLRHNDLYEAKKDLEILKNTLEYYMVDYSNYPQFFPSQLTTPIAYLPTESRDICAPAGRYAYAHDVFNFVLISSGPDGTRDISPRHFLLTRELENDQSVFDGRFLYVCFTPEGYKTLDAFTPGADFICMRYTRVTF